VGFVPKKSDRTKFCGRDCGLAFIAAKQSRLIVKHSVKRTKCADCQKWFTADYAVQVRCGPCKEENPWNYNRVKGTQRECKQCGAAFLAKENPEFPSLSWCSETCFKQHRKHNTEYQHQQQAAKARRRARKKGATRLDRINPFKVFERDNWRCGICGRKTQKAKRGTFHPRAPEMDHIVALANGGSHTWDNVQCACRECNGKKRTKSFGQLLLFPAA
jgi:5-methylcytosine-specific restriction endonuclease McrA